MGSSNYERPYHLDAVNETNMCGPTNQVVYVSI